MQRVADLKVPDLVKCNVRDRARFGNNRIRILVVTLTAPRRGPQFFQLEGNLKMKMANLESLLHDGLREIYYAEKKIMKALPKMIRAAQSTDLQAAFDKHLTETEQQVERLQQVFELMGKRAQAKTCPAIDGILEEGEEVMETYKGSPALDAGLVAAAQAVEHYEMARYGTLCAWASVLGMDDAADLLQQTLVEETATDEALSSLADASINSAAILQAA